MTIDTAMGGCHVYVSAEAPVSRAEPMTHGQAERLVPLIEETLKEAQIQHKKLEAILTTIGPGAFTGLRVGISTAKALSLSLSIPVYGISTLQALAASYETKEPFTVLIETRRDDFYVQSFDERGKATSEAEALSAEQIWESTNKETIFIGDGAERFKTLVPDAQIEGNLTAPDLEKVTAFVAENLEVITENPEPLYLRGADVSTPKNAPRKLGA